MWRSCCEDRLFAVRDSRYLRSNLRVYLEKPVPAFVRDVIVDIAENARKYKENEASFREWEKLSRKFGVGSDVIAKVRRKSLDVFEHKANEGMVELAKLVGADAGATNTYWYHLIIGNYEIVFVDQDDRFCFNIVRDWNDMEKRRYVREFGCIYGITLEDALVILYNIAKEGW